ncbi:MAG: hypothetical protein WCD20_05240 [Rhodomicrobium sp.]
MRFLPFSLSPLGPRPLSLPINLGLAYRSRANGSRKENIERAIAAFAAVVAERPRSNAEWARAQMLLGYAYIDREDGDRNANYLSAIRAFDAALSAKSLYVGVVQKAEIQDRRGDLYLLLEPKDSAENIENAIAAYKAAIEYKPQGNKVELRKRAASAEKLGTCYRQRKQGSAAENAAQAAEAFGQALAVFTRETYPEDYSRVQALREEAQAKAAAPAHEPL